MIKNLRLACFALLLFVLTDTPAQTTFIIESVPDATPTTDSIFICGSFNDWVPNDSRYVFKRQVNGQLAVTIPAFRDTVEYKFTRGSWTKVETDGANQYTTNRMLPAFYSGEVFVTIDNWLDLGGARKLSFINFYFFACAFQGAILCLLVLRIPKKEMAKVVLVLTINGTLVVMLILVVLNEITTFWQRYAYFVFQMSLFLIGPVTLYFVNTFTQRMVRGKLYYFVPLLIVTWLNVAQLMNIDVLSVLSMPFIGFVSLGELGLVTLATIFNLILVWKTVVEFPALKKFPSRTESERTRFLFWFFWTATTAMLLVPVSMLISLSGVHTGFVERYYSVSMVLSFLIFIEAYYFWRYPDIVREEKTPSPITPPSGWEAKLDAAMRETKVFRKPDLSIHELAEVVGIKPHSLSKLINETHQKNFRDFVNGYRIEEFISLAEKKEFRHYTFLALAQEAGFNSKSTFNLAFKKYTNRSPSAYFKSKPVSKVQELTSSPDVPKIRI